VKVINLISKLVFGWMDSKSIKRVIAEEEENGVIDPINEPIRKWMSTIKTTRGSSQQANVFITVVS
jgi:hypothetical protein